ncbi:MAG: hypothetical protein ACOX5R_06060 [bacterium]
MEILIDRTQRVSLDYFSPSSLGSAFASISEATSPGVARGFTTGATGVRADMMARTGFARLKRTTYCR